jgi:hypothetical protein
MCLLPNRLVSSSGSKQPQEQKTSAGPTTGKRRE